MTSGKAQKEIDALKLQAEEKQRDHEWQMEASRMDMEAQRLEHERQMVAKQQEHDLADAAHKREMQKRDKENKENEKQRKHALEMAEATKDQPNPTSPSNPHQVRKFPFYRTGDNTEAFLANFERTCAWYKLPNDQYMVTLRPQLSGPLSEVAAEMEQVDMDNYEIFKEQAHIRRSLICLEYLHILPQIICLQNQI